MADNLNPADRTRTMQAVKSKDSKMEVKFRSSLWRRGFRFFKNVKSLPGKPDVVFPKKKIAIFLDSCFWHGCPLHLKLPVSNADYWRNKIEKNRNRDKEINTIYKEMNWKILRIWEHDLKTDFESCLVKVTQNLENQRIPETKS